MPMLRKINIKLLLKKVLYSYVEKIKKYVTFEKYFIPILRKYLHNSNKISMYICFSILIKYFLNYYVTLVLS